MLGLRFFLKSSWFRPCTISFWGCISGNQGKITNPVNPNITISDSSPLFSVYLGAMGHAKKGARGAGVLVGCSLMSHIDYLKV